MRKMKSPSGRVVELSDRLAAYELGRDIGWEDITDAAPDGKSPKKPKAAKAALDTGELTDGSN